MGAVIRKQQEAADRLSQFGIGLDVLERAVVAGAMAADTCTPYDPPGFRGYTNWGVCVRSLRHDLHSLGWTLRDRWNMPQMISADGSTAVTAVTGDEATGQETGTPHTKNPRGSVMRDAILRNIKMPYLFEDMERERVELEKELEEVTWILLFHRAGDRIHYELSRPAAWDDQGRVSDWTERILFAPIGPVDRPTISTPEQEPAIAIEVARKAN